MPRVFSELNCVLSRFVVCSLIWSSVVSEVWNTTWLFVVGDSWMESAWRFMQKVIIACKGLVYISPVEGNQPCPKYFRDSIVTHQCLWCGVQFDPLWYHRIFRCLRKYATNRHFVADIVVLFLIQDKSVLLRHWIVRWTFFLKLKLAITFIFLLQFTSSVVNNRRQPDHSNRINQIKSIIVHCELGKEESTSFYKAFIVTCLISFTDLYFTTDNQDDKAV